MSTSAFRTFVGFVLNALALAMGVAAVVLYSIGTSTPANILPMLSFGLVTLALSHMVEK
jgi:hypothetical protein